MVRISSEVAVCHREVQEINKEMGCGEETGRVGADRIWLGSDCNESEDGNGQDMHSLRD